MNYNDIQDELIKQKEMLESMGYTVLLVGLYGSQNYGLDINTDEYKSDIDTKAIIIPTLDDLVNNSKPVSVVYNTIVGQCEVKDIRSFFNTFVKANPAYLEILYSHNYLVNDEYINLFNLILENLDDLFETIKPFFVKAVIGMIKEKEINMHKITPSTQENIFKYGYDPKNAHHVLRLSMLLEKVICEGYDLAEGMNVKFSKPTLVIDLKTGKFDNDTANKIVVNWRESAVTIANNYLENINLQTIDYSVKYKLLELSNEIIKKKIKKDIIKEGFKLCLKNLEN